MPDLLHLPRKPPPPSKTPTNSLTSTSPQLSCGLDIPMAESWMANKDEIAQFSRTHYDRFLYDTSYTSFPLYLRDHFARDLVASSVFCDSVGTCGLTSCQFLNPELSPHDKHMAYYVFEQISRLDHLFKSQRIAMDEAAMYIDGRIPETIRTYSAAPRIKQQLQDRLNDRRRYEKLAMAVVAGAGLIAGGAMALPVFGIAETMAVSVTNMVTNTYISIVGTTNAARPDPEQLTSDLEENLRQSLNDFRHVIMINIMHDMQSFMEGDRNKRDQDLIGILEGEYFFRRDGNIQGGLEKMAEEMMFRSVVNGAWAQERSYIVWADVAYGGCEHDTRGPAESRVCLAEHPTSVYYVYALDISRKCDSLTDDKALIHCPTSYRNLIQGRQATPYGITMEDIVRSSRFVHENKLHDAIHNLDYSNISAALQHGKYLGKNYGKFPGSFSLPISRNPGGEAISSVWVNKARNYPCMSGEFGWNDGTWSRDKDESFEFLFHSGLMFSEDFEDFCSHNGKCKGDDEVDWHSKLDALRRPGDPQIPKSLKHLFKRCKQKTKHGAGESWHDFDENPPLDD